ncbi:hypothetical protein [Reyranella sp.]|uniref:hypothetical protein n=1 Tax=Reyranella sp. TaxID=1929291 RepID=UPI003D0BE761
MKPFILREKLKLASEPAPSTQHTYDQVRQIWIDRKSGKPLVMLLERGSLSSQFGETTLTETREGVDQTESSNVHDSQFKETALTGTREAAKQREVIALRPSQFGETSTTATLEGVDQSDTSVALSSPFGETTITKTFEGTDQREVTATAALDDSEFTSANAPYSYI